MVFNPVCTLNNTFYDCDTIYIYGVGNDAEMSGDYTLGISPNPATDIIKVRLPVELVKDLGEIEVFDVLGKRWLHLHTNASEGKSDVEISIEGLKSGVYILQFTGKTSKVTSRFQIIR